jgi:hypothetical protein
LVWKYTYHLATLVEKVAFVSLSLSLPVKPALCQTSKSDGGRGALPDQLVELLLLLPLKFREKQRCLRQGCQIFLVTAYKNGKIIPNNYKIY